MVQSKSSYPLFSSLPGSEDFLSQDRRSGISGLDRKLGCPHVIREYVRTYQEERSRLSAEADIKRVRLERRIDELSREIDRLVDAIAKGYGDAAS
jgi:hypothetical protein